MNSSNEHILIIGASSPIAFSAIECFATEGYKLSLVCRSQPELQKNSDMEALCTFFSFNLENIDDISSLFQEITKKNGEITRICFFQRYRGNNDSWEGENRVSIQATQRIIELFQSYSSSRPDRSVVIVTSSADLEVHLDQPLSYHMAKASLGQIIRYSACILGTSKIRINGVKPAIVIKPRAEKYFKNNPGIVQLYDLITPLGRMGTPYDIANVVFFLSSEKSSFVTGQIISVDGGLSIHENASLARLIHSRISDKNSK